MRIIVNTTSMVPIYEQIVEQVKTMILDGTLKQESLLPSVRTLAKELKISALTVKKAYDNLEADGFTVTVHGKGTYVNTIDPSLLLEQRQKEVEADLELAIRKGRACNLNDEELKQMFMLLLEEETC